MSAPRDATVAIVLAAGQGSRLSESSNKVFLRLGPASILVHAARTFSSHSRIAEVLVVAAEAEVPVARTLLAEAGLTADVVAGGSTRHASEWAAIRCLAPRIESGEIATLVIHDAARPLYAGEALDELLGRAGSVGAAILATPIDAEEGVRRLERGHLRGAPEGSLWRAQTPQAFRAPLLLDAFRRLVREGVETSDTASTVERAGHAVAVVPGPATNLKITYPEDLLVAQVLFELRQHRAAD